MGGMGVSATVTPLPEDGILILRRTSATSTVMHEGWLALHVAVVIEPSYHTDSCVDPHQRPQSSRSPASRSPVRSRSAWRCASSWATISRRASASGWNETAKPQCATLPTLASWSRLKGEEHAAVPALRRG